MVVGRLLYLIIRYQRSSYTYVSIRSSLSWESLIRLNRNCSSSTTYLLTYLLTHTYMYHYSTGNCIKTTSKFPIITVLIKTFCLTVTLYEYILFSIQIFLIIIFDCRVIGWNVMMLLVTKDIGNHTLYQCV